MGNSPCRHWLWYNTVLSSDGPKSAITRLVLTAVYKYASKRPKNPDYMTCYPTQATIATDCDLTPRSVGTHLKKAEAEGWLKREGHFKNGQNWKNHIYELTLPIKSDSSMPALESYPQGHEPRSVALSLPTESNALPGESLSETTRTSEHKDPNEVPTNRLSNRPSNISINKSSMDKEVLHNPAINSTRNVRQTLRPVSDIALDAVEKMSRMVGRKTG
jgi:hypothetical protein